MSLSVTFFRRGGGRLEPGSKSGRRIHAGMARKVSGAGPLSVFGTFVFRDEVERDAVGAVAKAGRFRAVVENATGM